MNKPKLSGTVSTKQANACEAGHEFDYAYDLNYDVPFNPMVDQSDHVISIADIYRCARCGVIDIVE